MKAFRKFSENEPAALIEIEAPHPQEGELGIKVLACGLNFADLLMLKGTYQDTPEMPFSPGMEVCGIVDSIGANVTGFEIGQRIAVFGGSGGMSEYVCMPANRCLPVPDSMDDVTAAGFQAAYGTSHVALTHTGNLQKGERLLVTGAAGGVGLTAVEIGHQMGAEVVAIARGEKKLAIAKKAGATHLIDAESDDIRGQLKALGGIDVTYDAVGGDLFEAAFRATNTDGRLLVIGFASGTVPTPKLNHMLVKNISVRGLYWGGYFSTNPSVPLKSMETLFEWHTAGRLKPHISHVLPFEQIEEALDLLRTRRSTGKVVVTMS